MPDIFDLSSLQQELIANGDMDCAIIKNRFYEIGSVEGIVEFNHMLKRRKNVFRRFNYRSKCFNVI